MGAVLVGTNLLGDDGDDADDRSSGPAPTFDDEAEPTPTDDPAPDSDRSPDSDPAPGADGGSPSIALERIVDIERPSAVADPPGPGPVLVSTLAGEVHAVDLDAGTSDLVLDLTDLVSTGFEQGLLGIAVDPAGERLYVDYTDTAGDTDIRSWPLVDGAPEGGPNDGVLHLELGQPFPNHNGGNLVFGPDGLLWIGTGDGGSAGDPEENAQDPSTLLGKMLRVAPDPEGGVSAPASNPDFGGRPEIWAIGLRNPWRYSFDRETGDLWVADVGQNAVEEVSTVAVDADLPNFGWDDVEGDQDFEGTSQPGFIDPVVTYANPDDGCSITGGYVYRGTAVEALRGWYVFGDFCGGWIRAVPAGDPTSDPVELLGDAGGALSFAELEDGELLFLTLDGIDRIVGA